MFRLLIQEHNRSAPVVHGLCLTIDLCRSVIRTWLQGISNKPYCQWANEQSLPLLATVTFHGGLTVLFTIEEFEPANENGNGNDVPYWERCRKCGDYVSDCGGHS